jgi:two-component sensor histidine kinase
MIYDDTRYRLVLRLSLLFAVLLSIVALLNYREPKYNGSLDLIVVAICLTSYLVLLKTKKYKIVGALASFSALIIIGLALFTTSALHYTTPMWMIVDVLFTFIVLRKTVGVIVLVLNFLMLFVYIYFFLGNNISQLPPLTNYGSLLYIVEFFVLGIAIGYLLFVLINVSQHSERQMMAINATLNEKNALITKQTSEMELMLKEIHHRVKNNLQIISSLLRLQAESVKTDDRSVYYEAVNRVSAMAIIHEKMYQNSALSDFNLSQYIDSLLHSLFESYSIQKVKTSVNVHVDKLPSKSLVPLAMLLNEMVSNSIKHAFVNHTSPEIKIVIADVSDDQFIVEYFDNGKWVEKQSDSFGLEIIDAMTQQLDGSQIRKSTEEGTFSIFVLHKLS